MADAMSISEGECTDSETEDPYTERLIDGKWSMKEWRVVDAEENLVCKRCSITFNTRFSYDLHMAGLRHHQNCSVAAATDERSSVELNTGRSLATKTGMLERNVELFQQLTRTEPIEVAECSTKRNKLTNIFARNVSLFEKLSNRLILNHDGVDTDNQKEMMSNVDADAASKQADNAYTVFDSVKVTPVECEKTSKSAEEKTEDNETNEVAAADCNNKDNEDNKEMDEKNLVSVPSREIKEENKQIDDESLVNVPSSEIKEEKVQVNNDNEDTADIPRQFNSLFEPVLGADYMCEYKFLNGTIERTCDLCEMTVTESVEEHSRTTEHILRYIFYNEQEAYRLMSVAGRLTDTSCIHQVANAVEQKHGRHQQARVYQETDNRLTDADDSMSWTEVKDETVRPVSDLRGHRMHLEYSGRRLASETSQPVNDLPTLLDNLALQSCLAQGKPPSLKVPVNRLNLISSIAKFVVKNDADAEVSLQMANTLTLGVLSYRQQMLPGLKPNDRIKYENRLEKLITEAEMVATKASRREITTEPVMMIPSAASKMSSITV